MVRGSRGDGDSVGVGNGTALCVGNFTGAVDASQTSVQQVSEWVHSESCYRSAEDRSRSRSVGSVDGAINGRTRAFEWINLSREFRNEQFVV